MAGAVRYTQYSLMVFGHARIPIMGWMRERAAEALVHATQAGEEVSALGARVSLGIGDLAGTHHDSVDDIMQALLMHERAGIELYRLLLKLSEGGHGGHKPQSGPGAAPPGGLLRWPGIT